MTTFFPIIFIHGWGGPTEIYRNFGSQDERDPYVGWNVGHRYNDPDGWVKFNDTERNFEGLVLRLVKDFNYYDASNDENLESYKNVVKQFKSGPSPKDATLGKSIWIFRYYEYRDLKLSEAAKTFLKNELSTRGYKGDLDGIPYYAALLANKIQQITSPEYYDISKGQTAPGLNLPNVALVGHSMGGLISRFVIQYNLFGMAEKVARLMTFATPHGGASLAGPLGLLPMTFHKDFQYFTPQWVETNLGGQKAKDFKKPIKLKNHQVFCLVGTRHVSPLPHTDDVVDQREAYIAGYPYAYVYNTHTGEHGIRENGDGYQSLRRFLFGDLYVQVQMKSIQKKPVKAGDTGKDKYGDVGMKFFFQYYVKPRGINAHLNELSERSENQPRSRTMNELGQYLAQVPYTIYDGFADSTAIVPTELQPQPGIQADKMALPHLQLEHYSFLYNGLVGAQAVGSGCDMIPLVPDTISEIPIEDEVFQAVLLVKVSKRL